MLLYGSLLLADRVAHLSATGPLGKIPHLLFAWILLAGAAAQLCTSTDTVSVALACRQFDSDLQSINQLGAASKMAPSIKSSAVLVGMLMGVDAMLGCLLVAWGLGWVVWRSRVSAR